MEKSFDLSVVRCRGPATDDVWMLFLAPPNTRSGSFYFAEDSAKGLRYRRELAPPHKLDNRNLPLDAEIVSIEKIHTITRPHLGGPNGFIQTITAVLARDNRSFIIDALFALERAFLVPDGTWAIWDDVFALDSYAAVQPTEDFLIPDPPQPARSTSPKYPTTPASCWTAECARPRSTTPQRRRNGDRAGSARKGKPASKQRNGGQAITY